MSELHSIGPLYADQYGCVRSKTNEATCINEPAIVVDIAAGIMLKLGESRDVEDYFMTRSADIHAAGLGHDVRLRLYQFDRSGPLSLDDIVTLINAVYNDPGEKAARLLTMTPGDICTEIKRLQAAGY